MPLESVEERRQRDLQRFRDLGDREDRDVADAALNPRHVGPVEMSLISQSLLRPGLAAAEFTDPLSHLHQERVRSVRHPVMVEC